MPIGIEENIDKLEERVATRQGAVILLALLRSRYFLVSLIIYVSILLIFGGYKITEYLVTRGAFEGVEQLLVLPPPTPPPPRPPPEKMVEQQEVRVTATKTPVVRITVNAPSTFVRAETPPVAPVVKVAEIKLQTEMSQKIQQQQMKRLADVRDFQKVWNVQDQGRRTRAKLRSFKPNTAVATGIAIRRHCRT